MSSSLSNAERRFPGEPPGKRTRSIAEEHALVDKFLLWQNRRYKDLVEEERKLRWGVSLAIDFDGVLHRYSKGWCDGVIYDSPCENAVESMWELVRRGYEPYVLTAREDHEAVREWLEKWDFPELEVSNVKRPALAYIDDKAMHFDNWAETLDQIPDPVARLWTGDR